MALITSQPTSNTTPDGGGTSAVTGISNTGHTGNTIAFAPGPGLEIRSARWSGFQSVSGQTLEVKLKVDWTQNGSITAGGSNDFILEFSTNGGSNWSAFSGFPHATITSSTNGTAEATLNNTQDLSQVQVRESFSAEAPGGGDAASITISLANIRLEVTTVDAQVIVMM